MTAMLRCDRARFVFSDAPMSSKVKIAARLRPRLAGEPPDDGGLRICRPEPSVNASSCSANNSANSSASSTSGSFTGIAVANPRDTTQIFTFPCVLYLLGFIATHP
jgi:hypothetical protein